MSQVSLIGTRRGVDALKGRSSPHAYSASTSRVTSWTFRNASGNAILPVVHKINELSIVLPIASEASRARSAGTPSISSNKAVRLAAERSSSVSRT